jgi:hypothetical protein
VAGKTTDIVVSALAEWNGKALTKGQKDISAFDKGIKKLGKTFAAVFGTAAILNYSKNAVNAFQKDQAAAKALEVQLNNTGYAFSAPGVELYIANLEKMYGVLDDQLRPAFQSLLTASGSLIQSQKALNIALDVSAATGKSVEEVSAAIAKGYTGQTTALGRLGAGIQKTTLASGDMNLILEELGNKFAGQATARLDTYAGKIDLLQGSANRASETIGKGLLDSLSMLGKDQNIGNLGTAMEKVAQTIANVVVGLAAILGKVVSIGTAIFDKLHLDSIVGFLYKFSGISFLANLGKTEANKPSSNFSYSLGTGAAGEIAKAQELKILKEKNTVNKQLLATDKAKLALNDLAKKFDVDRINLVTALNAATDEETKLRLKSQLALLDQDAALAKKYNAELEGVAALNALNAATKGLTLQMGASISDIQKYLAASAVTYSKSISSGMAPTVAPDAITASQVNAYLATKATEITADTQSYLEKLRTTVKDGYAVPSVTDFYGSLTGIANSQPQQSVNNNITITAQGSILALQDLDQAIADAMLRIQRQNGTLTPAGYLP